MSIVFSSCSDGKQINVDYTFELAKDVQHRVRDFNQVKFTSDKNLDLGFYKGEVWIKLEISNNETPQAFLVLCNDLINHNYRFYKLDTLKNTFETYQNNIDLEKYDHRSFSFAKPNFKIDLKSNEKSTFLITTKSDGRILQATPQLISLNQFHSIKQKTFLFDIVFYCSMLLLLLFNLFYFRLIRSGLYYYYGAYILSGCLMYMFVEGRMFGLGMSNVLVDHLMFISIRVWILFSFFFQLKFLETKLTNPKYYRFIIYLLTITLGFTTIYQLLFSSFSISTLHQFENIAGFIWIVLSLITIGIAYKSRKKLSIYYLISYSALLFFITLGLVDSHTTVLPGDPFTYFKIGTIFEFIGFTYFITLLIKKELKKTEDLESKLIENRKKLIIASEKLEEKDKLLTTRVKKIDLISVFNLLENTLSTEAEWDNFKQKIKELNPSFLDQLLTKHTDLSKSEIRLLTLIKIGYSQKEIANILNIAPDSVKKSRSRVRKKLSLTETTNLKEYLNNL